MPMNTDKQRDLMLTLRDRRTILKPFSVLLITVVVGFTAALLLRRDEPPPRQWTCTNNLHECAIALQIYTADYDGMLPSSAIVRKSKTWSKADFVRFATKLGTIPVQTDTSLQTWSQALYSYMKAKDIMFCPYDPSDRLGPGAHVSYYWKTAVDKAWYGVGCKKQFRKLGDYSNAADAIILYERAGFHDERKRFLRKSVVHELANGVKINVAYLDTHIRNVTLTNCTAGSMTDPTSPGEPMYFNFDRTKPKGSKNPPDASIATDYVDPSRYSDALP